MHEYVTLSASSYDPAALATKLTEKSADGWDVVSIVQTGGDVTAFLRRSSGSGTSPGDEAEPVLADTAPDDGIEPATEAAPDTESEPVPVSSWSADSEPTPEPEPEPVSEPAGWGVAPIIAADAAGDAAAEAATDRTPEPTPEPEPAVDPMPTTVYTPDPTPAATPEPAAAVAPAVPAGWYADPSGRFELRYWDGAAWTEHVARGGQQFTDPPVA